MTGPLARTGPAVGRGLSLLALALPLVLLACGGASTGAAEEARRPPQVGHLGDEEVARHELAVATFAGGCFWCMEPPFDALDGVLSTTSGYSGGDEERPTYERVSAGLTGHAEVVRVLYDPRRISYQRLLDVFWRNIDPTAVDRQFCDQGRHYRSAIFVHDAEQRRLAEESLAALRRDPPFRGAIVTPVEDARAFWPAEDYHQDYYEKNPLRYKIYRNGCGRDDRLRELWGEEAGGQGR